jgi:hypothetical protein
MVLHGDQDQVPSAYSRLQLAEASGATGRTWGRGQQLRPSGLQIVGIFCYIECIFMYMYIYVYVYLYICMYIYTDIQYIYSIQNFGCLTLTRSHIELSLILLVNLLLCFVLIVSVVD